MKRCTKCRKWKSLVEFSSAPKAKDGKHCWCKKCQRKAERLRRARDPGISIRDNQRTQQWRKDNPEAYHAQWWRQYLKRTYGLTTEQHAALFATQNGACAICKVIGVELQVDHEHGSHPLKVRGLLCQTCNTALGKFSDSVEVLQQAVAYLQGKL